MPNPFSDHDAVLLTLQIPNQNQKGQGYWKLNTSTLSHRAFKKIFENFWKTGKNKNQNIIPLINGGNYAKFILKF